MTAMYQYIIQERKSNIMEGMKRDMAEGRTECRIEEKKKMAKKRTDPKCREDKKEPITN